MTCLMRNLASGLVHFFPQPALSHPWFAAPFFWGDHLFDGDMRANETEVTIKKLVHKFLF